MSYVRKLPGPLKAYRIGDPKGEFAVWDEGGALNQSGRWHAAGEGVIYASEYYSTAMLEKLVHYRGRLPPNQHYIEISIPAGVSYEALDAHSLPGWPNKNGHVSRRHGSGWYKRAASALLVVPSVVARMERNIIINTHHQDFQLIKPGLETPVLWDERLYK